MAKLASTPYHTTIKINIIAATTSYQKSFKPKTISNNIRLLSMSLQC